MKHRVAAIGTFDGVHIGHRSVLKKLIEYARENDMEPVALTFDKHPLALIAPEKTPDELTPLWKKRKLLSEVDAFPLIVEFNEPVRSCTARDWLKRLHDDYNVRALVVGYDNTFGSDGLNLSLEDYRRLGEQEGIEVLTAKEIRGVSSSAIRKAVKAGDVERAGEMLGRPFSITAPVVGGNQLGRGLGFPTANIEIKKGMAVPKPGSYAGIVKILSDGSKHPAMINIGTRPTLMRGNEKVIEAHLIDWEGNLYGKEITVRFLKRLRDENKFDSIEALRQQLAKDKQEVKELLK